MALLTNDNYTLQKIKIETDKLELQSFFHELIFSLSIINRTKNLHDEFLKREVLAILNKIHKKLNDPNIKTIRAFSFNYYESITLRLISNHNRKDNHFFDVVFWKVDGKIRKPN